MVLFMKVATKTKLSILKPEFSPHGYGQISWKKYYEIRMFLRIDDKTE